MITSRFCDFHGFGNNIQEIFNIIIISLGEKLTPDFFLDEAEHLLDGMSSSPSDANTPAAIFASVRSLASESIVNEIKGTYLFILTGESGGHWLLNLKTGSGSVEQVSGDTPADVIMTMDAKNMVDMFQGKLNATTAFMTGKLRISGNMGLAMKLDKLMGKIRSKL